MDFAILLAKTNSMPPQPGDQSTADVTADLQNAIRFGLGKPIGDLLVDAFVLHSLDTAGSIGKRPSPSMPQHRPRCKEQRKNPSQVLNCRQY